MFNTIVLAYNDTPQCHRALTKAIQLTTIHHARLSLVTVMERLPAYTAYAWVVQPGLQTVLLEDRLKFYQQLQEKARTLALKQDCEIETHLMDGDPVQAIVDLVKVSNATF